MKKIIYLLVFTLLYTFAHAQTYSNWITDIAHPTLQIRWATKKDANNYSYLKVEIKSTAGCKLNLTASLCNADANDKNGWKFITLYRDKPLVFFFKILNSCNNGFWWWYKDYKSTAVRYDDN
jgi:hypothetical protein